MFYKNIGRKIKMLAKIEFYIGIIFSILFSAIIFFAAIKSENVSLCITATIILIGGFLASWIGNFFIYGFGEIIDKLCEIENNTKSVEENKAVSQNEEIENLNV